MKDEHQHDVDEVAIRKLILNEWSRDRIVKFSTHLLGDKCQDCAAMNTGRSKLPSFEEMWNERFAKLKQLGFSDSPCLSSKEVFRECYEFIEQKINRNNAEFLQNK